MIRMELVRDPNGMEDDFVVVDIDGDVSVYRENEFKVDIDGENVSIVAQQIPFYSARG